MANDELPPRLIAFAHELADAARAETTLKGEQGFAVEAKNGSGPLDPVTEADRGAELAMRRLIEAEFPDHGIAGEEFPDRPGSGPFSWSLDPIDGTRAFVCGLPSWTTLIALLKDGDPVLGVIDVPRLNERYVGYGSTAYLVTPSGEQPIRVSGCRTLAETRLATTDPYLFDEPELDAFTLLRKRARLTRYGWDAYGYARIAAGTIDLVMETGLKPHDYNALVPIVRAAGGAVANWSGDPDLSHGQILAAASQELLEEVRSLLSQAVR
jgi:myo-inositol-1(or 4)-monophosphatase